jgi:hypothetical protein
VSSPSVATAVCPAVPQGNDRPVPSKRANVKNPKQYEALKDKGMSKERAAKIANSPKASSHGGQAAAGKKGSKKH